MSLQDDVPENNVNRCMPSAARGANVTQYACRCQQIIDLKTAESLAAEPSLRDGLHVFVKQPSGNHFSSYVLMAVDCFW
jgi:hypothetical protein